MIVDARKLDRKVRIEKPIADTNFDGAGSGAWELVAEVWASVQDALPSRGEQLADGINVTARPARVRMRFRADVSAQMRLVDPNGRIMQIITAPAELGRRDGLEFMVEDYSAAGGGA